MRPVFLLKGKRGEVMARFCPLASGSSGNSTYISRGDCAVLIDAGISYKAMAERVGSAGGDIEKIAAVALTHSHIDHISGIKTLLIKTGAPLFTTEESAEALIQKNLLPANAKVVLADGAATFGDFEIVPFKTSHDVPGSRGFRIRTGAGDCAVCTDLGIVTDEVRGALSGCNTVLFEFNHDLDMLRRGPYRPDLKIRILSDLGHLSNVSAAAEVPFLLDSGVKQIICGHISRQNNTPDIALSSARIAAEAAGVKAGVDFLLSAARPGMSEVSVF